MIISYQISQKLIIFSPDISSTTSMVTHKELLQFQPQSLKTIRRPAAWKWDDETTSVSKINNLNWRMIFKIQHPSPKIPIQTHIFRNQTQFLFMYLHKTKLKPKSAQNKLHY